MFRYDKKLPALALAGMLALFLAPEARAQTANDVSCNKCVGKRDLAKNAVVRNRIKNNAVTGAKVKDGSLELEDLSPAVQQVIADLQAQVAALQPLAALAPFITVDEVETDLNGDGNIDPASERLPRILIQGANVQIVNGDPTETTSTRNGLGNLIVGYNEPRTGGNPVCSDGQFDNQPDCVTAGNVFALDHKSGSHNLVVGPENAYSQAGAAVFGQLNVVNRAGAAVTGGLLNVANGLSSSISGGSENMASGDFSSVSGGELNEASGAVASVSGGSFNQASGVLSSVTGGQNGDASGLNSSVSGGQGGRAIGAESSVTGGRNGGAVGIQSSVTGGNDNGAVGIQSSVTGGADNSAQGNLSSISGGEIITVADDLGWATAGFAFP